MIALASRNIKLFFRDKAMVFFSLLSVFIIIGLYVLFLGNVWTSEFPNQEYAKFIMNSWIMAGLISVTGFTTAVGAFGIMIQDRELNIEKDFLSAPVKRSSLAAGYLLSAYGISVIMSLIAFILGEIFILAEGGELLGIVAIFKIIGIILINSFMSVSIIQVIIGFIHTANAFSAFSTIIGTLIGFLTGIYLPIGQLPTGVQTLIRIFPVSHSASLARQIFMDVPLKIGFNGVPEAAVNGFKELMGVTFFVGSKEITPWMSLCYMLLIGALFFAIAAMNLSKRKLK
ncbi:MAG TPA: ABC transporter permease [Flexilinea sp.]|nr:ABC transporter permease [Flexilinea sp.]